jgi:chemotaxis methyl-accepting protein methylase
MSNVALKIDNEFNGTIEQKLRNCKSMLNAEEYDTSELNALYLHAQKDINGQFKQLLLDLAKNNETSFFRDTKVFKTIEKELLLLLLERNSQSKQPLRICSAASSTGQKALTTAIVINEFNLKNNMNVLFNIIGTDISERVLIKAKNGIYSQLGLSTDYDLINSDGAIVYCKKEATAFKVETAA